MGYATEFMPGTDPNLRGFARYIQTALQSQGLQVDPAREKTALPASASTGMEVTLGE